MQRPYLLHLHFVDDPASATIPCPCEIVGMSWLPYAVRPGDELDLETTVLEMRESKSKPDRGIVCTRVLLRNQRRETALECTSNIFVARRPDANAATPS
jgi:hypothetical protein